MKICVPICENSVEKVCEKITAARDLKIDFIEIWCGEIAGICDAGKRGKIFEKIFDAVDELPILANCKNAAERGSFSGNDSQKLEILIDAAKRGAKFIDFDWQFPIEFLNEFRENAAGAELILSAHFWEKTPSLPKLLEIARKMKTRGADILKFAATATAPRDLITILRLAENFQKNGTRHISIAMGKVGAASRVLVPEIFGGEFAFAAVEESLATAPGQFSVAGLRGVAGGLGF